jgi:hypothetical protein
MSTNCKDIQYVLDLVIKGGNSVKEIQKGWSEMDEVIVMKNPLKPDIKNDVLSSHPDLEYWEFDGSPMDPPDKGFACIKCSVSISFPKANKFCRYPR